MCSRVGGRPIVALHRRSVTRRRAGGRAPSTRSSILAATHRDNEARPGVFRMARSVSQGDGPGGVARLHPVSVALASARFARARRGGSVGHWGTPRRGCHGDGACCSRRRDGLTDPPTVQELLRDQREELRLRSRCFGLDLVELRQRHRARSLHPVFVAAPVVRRPSSQPLSRPISPSAGCAQRADLTPAGLCCRAASLSERPRAERALDGVRGGLHERAAGQQDGGVSDGFGS